MPTDAYTAPASQEPVAAPFAEPAAEAQHDAAAYQEINARRAELERPELLRTIRAL